jgi:hypothetical protein
MNTQDIKKMGAAYLSVLEAMKKKNMDPVGQADADIDNDGDTDKSDEYLHKRRKAIAKSKEGKEAEKDMEEAVVMNKKPESEAAKKVRMALASAAAKAKPKDQVTLKKAPWDVKEDRSWVVYNRLLEKAGGREDHIKGATPPEAIDSKASKGEKDFVAMHGGLMGNDSGIDGAKAAQQTADAIAASVKAAPGRSSDNKQRDNMEAPKDTTKG